MSQTTLPFTDIPTHGPRACQSSGQRRLDALTETPVCPVTPSAEARARITASGVLATQVEAVAALVARYPGRTSRDLAAMGRLDAYQIARRLDDLRKAGRVRRGEKAVSCTGFSGWTWWTV